MVQYFVNFYEKKSWDHVTKWEPMTSYGESQLNFTGHCIRMPTYEPTNCFVIYESKIRSSLRPGTPRTTYLNQILSSILFGEPIKFETNEIRKMAIKKAEWNQIFIVLNKKKPPDRYSQPKWWWWCNNDYFLYWNLLWREWTENLLASSSSCLLQAF